MAESERPDNISVQRVELGFLLRQTREEQDISLEEAEKATRIRRQYLQDMEEGEFERLPGDVIARGFLRNYASFLGLDATELVSLYRNILPTAAPGSEWTPLEPAPRWKMEQRPVEVELSNGSPFPIVRIAALVAVVVILGLAGWQFLQRNPQFIAALGPSTVSTITPTRELSPLAQASNTLPPPTAVPTFTPTPLVTSPLTQPTSTHTPSPTTRPEPTATPLSSTSASTGIEMAAKITARTWVQATVDGNVVLTGLLEAGEEYVWRASQAIYLNIGNAGGIELTLDGNHLGLLGDSNQVIQRIWALQNGLLVVTDENGNPVQGGTVSPGVATSIDLTAKITSSIQIKATVDGNIEFEGVLQPGEERQWTALQWLRLDTDNGGGLELTLNGQPLGTLGEAGQATRTFWSLQGDQVLRLDETVSAQPGG